jgi:hypothetical protein
MKALPVGRLRDDADERGARLAAVRIKIKVLGVKKSFHILRSKIERL